MTANRTRHYLARAAQVAALSTERQKHGALVVKSGKTLAVGVNRFRNDPNIVTDPKRQASVHAEIAVLNALSGVDLRGAAVYVARVNRMGAPMLSKPCEDCEAALIERGVRKVYWT